ncbi:MULTISPECIES: type VII secretion protein EccB [unclassified Streptomyces]|uniref:type VII secretion protein EccB n=1 Tax=unclassified Streptomyces TaxID=2593676 RepID=UPI002E819030|nr:type VII secretion protein EccB [Streptomyces sp. NBC_00523]WUD02713.1 type VII secretion protein EccB [Streptomyces sp. NBC_00523]
MVTRRDELNAYTFAKRRALAAFLQPMADGSDEGAPRPLRAVLPGVLTGALLLAGFGAYGMFRPVAPKGWDRPGAKVVVGRTSTTRYVVLTTGRGAHRRTRLHPVLNLASARLLLDPGDYGVVQVADDVLDAGGPPRGPVIGIPYAPDRLPGKRDAGTAKRWAVCVRPGGGGSGVQRAGFVLAARDHRLTEGPNRLTGGRVLYVQDPHGTRYLVDARGTKYRVDERPGDLGHLTDALVGRARPRPVTDDWLATLHTGSPVAFPVVPGEIGAPARVEGRLSARENRVGAVLRTRTGAGTAYHVVLDGRVQPVSEFTAWLIVNSPQTAALDQAGTAYPAGLQDFVPDSAPFAGQAAHWPVRKAVRVDTAHRSTVCSVLRATDGRGRTTLSTWAGTTYPAAVGAGGTSTYVTPGSGLLYAQVRGRQTRPDGSLFLVTDTGLRYAVQGNGDGDPGHSALPAGSTSHAQGRANEAQTRLGYEGVRPALVPAEWSEFLPRGPRLDTSSARRPQGS